MTWSLELPVEIPSANALMRGRTVRARRARYSRLRRSMGWAVLVAGGHVPPASGPRRVRIVRRMGPRQLPYDDDNLAAGAKPLLDELVAHGLIRDDSPRWVSVEYAQERGSAPGARVEVSDDIAGAR